MTAATFDAQAPGIADRVKTCARAICAEEGGTWRRRRMVAERAWLGRDQKTPRAWVQARCQMTARARIDQFAGDLAKGGDDPFTLIWSRGSAVLIPQDRRLAFASGAELALITMFSTVASGANHFNR